MTRPVGSGRVTELRLPPSYEAPGSAKVLADLEAKLTAAGRERPHTVDGRWWARTWPWCWKCERTDGRLRITASSRPDHGILRMLTADPERILCDLCYADELASIEAVLDPASVLPQLPRGRPISAAAIVESTRRWARQNMPWPNDAPGTLKGAVDEVVEELLLEWSHAWPVPVGSNARRNWFNWRYGPVEILSAAREDLDKSVDDLLQLRLVNLMNLATSHAFLNRLPRGVNQPKSGFESEAWLGLALPRNMGKNRAWLFGFVEMVPLTKKSFWRFTECLVIPEGSGDSLQSWFADHFLIGEAGGRRTGSQRNMDQLFGKEKAFIRRLVEDEGATLRDITNKLVAAHLGVSERTLRNYDQDPKNPVCKPKDLAKAMYPELARRPKRQ